MRSFSSAEALMDTLHIACRNGSSTLHPEGQVEALCQAGEVSFDTLCWKPGQVDWVPLIRLYPQWFPEQVKKEEDARKPVKFKLQDTLLALEKRMLWSSYAIAGAALVSMTLTVLEFLSDVDWIPFDSLFAFVFEADMAVAIVFSLSALAYGVCFAMWQHRAVRNLKPLKSEGLQGTRIVHAIVSDFPPLSLLFSPLVLQQLWKVSLNPQASKAQERNARIGWACGLALLSFLLFLAPLVSETWNFSALLQQALNLAEGVAECLTLVLIRQVTKQIGDLQRSLRSRGVLILAGAEK